MHFLVTIIGEDPERQLAPFHAFGSTGRNDEFVEDVDKTDEARKDFNKGTRRRLRAPDGSLHDPHDNRFYRDPTPEEEPLLKEDRMGLKEETRALKPYYRNWDDGKGYRARVENIPAGYEDVRVPASEVESLLEYAESWYGCKGVAFGEEPDKAGEHKYGYTLLDENGGVLKIVSRENPRAKWDWYQLGGRWTGYFKLKPFHDGETGSPGLMTKPPNEGTADSANKGAIDFEGMRDEAAEKAGARWDRAHEVIAGRTVKAWEYLREVEHKGDIDAARKAYRAQPVVEDFRKHEDLIWESPEDFMMSRMEYVQDARNGACASFALIKDGQWYERDEKDDCTWNKEFAAMLDSVPDDTLISVYDYHI